LKATKNDQYFRLAFLNEDECICKAVVHSEKASTVAKIFGSLGG